MTTRIIDNSGADKIFVESMYANSKVSLEEFRNGIKERIVPRKLEIIEINPPQDGIAYIGKDFMHLSMSEGRGGFFNFERYWDKDGNQIGFGYKGQKYMFDKEKLPERGQEINVAPQVNKAYVPLESELVRAMTRAVGENNNMEIYGTEVLAIEPAIDGVAFMQKARGVAALAQKDSNVVEKSVWFDVVRLYDAKGAFLGMQVTDDNLFNKYDVANSGLVKADAKTMEMIKNANKKLEAVRDVNGSIVGFDLITMSKRQQFERGQARVTEIMAPNVPENSELAKYLEQYPEAILTPDRKWGWITKLPEGSYPELKLTAQRIKVWDKNGRYMSIIKGMQKEM